MDYAEKDNDNAEGDKEKDNIEEKTVTEVKNIQKQKSWNRRCVNVLIQ